MYSFNSVISGDDPKKLPTHITKSKGPVFLFTFSMRAKKDFSFPFTSPTINLEKRKRNLNVALSDVLLYY